MATSELFFSQNLATLVQFFHKNPFYELHWIRPPKKKTQFRAMLDCYRRNSQLEIGMDIEPQIVVTGQKLSFVRKFSFMYILLLSKFG
jgi:hypothetical protein